MIDAGYTSIYDVPTNLTNNDKIEIVKLINLNIGSLQDVYRLVVTHTSGTQDTSRITQSTFAKLGELPPHNYHLNSGSIVDSLHTYV